MKNYFFLFPIMIALMFGCAKNITDPLVEEDPVDTDSIYQEPEDPFLGTPDKMSVVMVSASKVMYNQWQKFFVWNEHSYIMVWPSENRKLVIKDVDKALKGIITDEITKTEVTTNFVYKGIGVTFQDLIPGKYVVAVILNEDVEKGKRAYSTKEITVKEHGKIYMKKIFSYNAKDDEFEEWTTKLIEK